MSELCPICKLLYPWGDPAAITGGPCFDCRERLRPSVRPDGGKADDVSKADDIKRNR